MYSLKHLKTYLLPVLLTAITLLAGLILPAATPVEAAGQIDLVGPAGSGQFGEDVTVLPNGNIVITDPGYDAGSVADVGAVYLYNGATRMLISTLTGSVTNDQVGSDGVTILSNGNYVVRSPNWDNGAATNAGAVTWGNGTTGVSGEISAANSLVGSATDDHVGYVAALSNGNYVVRSPDWDNGAATNAGAVTWGNGTTGVSGEISSTNSLVGGATDDRVGYYGVTILSNGNYAVRSPNWDNGAATNAGAVTWGNGATGVSGEISAANSLVGSATDDHVGYVAVLSNGNYVVRSPDWDNGATTNAGAVTWGNGTTGVSGEISAANSLVGSVANDQVGSDGVTALNNGNYVVGSPNWDNGATPNVGAVTWGDGMMGISGEILVVNSLVGSVANDQVGYNGVTALSNGNYVVSSPDWDNGATMDAGAATWGNGASGISGQISSTNSLVGSKVDDGVGGSVTVLSNGNYVVSSPGWGNSVATDAGAVTWGNGTTGIFGGVSSANSLVGSKIDDRVGWNGVAALSNGNYVVRSSYWDNGSATDVGAVTWGNGTMGVSGEVSSANSLVGSATNDQVGYYGVIVLSNGNYVVSSPDWDNGSATNAGAVTWGDGTMGISGEVSSTNSLVGSATNDQVGHCNVPDCIIVLSNSNYVVRSPGWDNGAATDAGAVTWGDGTTGIFGVVSDANSLVGGAANDQVGVGYYDVTVLNNGNYVVSSPGWDNGVATDAGAVTWGNGTTGISGVISAANSLVGSAADDQVGYVTALSNGNYVVRSPGWDNGATPNVGAVTWGDGGVVGTITAENSVRGIAANGGDDLNFAYDEVHHQLIVGRPADNIVTFFELKVYNYLPIVVK